MKTSTVGELRKCLKGLPTNMRIYVSSHDQSLYETIGPVSFARVLNQEDKDPWDNVEDDFRIGGSIEGLYLNLKL